MLEWVDLPPPPICSKNLSSDAIAILLHMSTYAASNLTSVGAAAQSERDLSEAAQLGTCTSLTPDLKATSVPSRKSL